MTPEQTQAMKNVGRWVWDRLHGRGASTGQPMNLLSQDELTEISRTIGPLKFANLHHATMSLDFEAKVLDWLERAVLEIRRHDVTFIASETGDWIGLYVNGRLAAEGHSLSGQDVAEALGFTVKRYEVDFVACGIGRCPEHLSDFEPLDH